MADDVAEFVHIDWTALPSRMEVNQFAADATEAANNLAYQVGSCRVC